MNRKDLKIRVDQWDLYKNPIDNLIFAILLQAVLDKDGYQDTNHSGKFYDGTEANNFLETCGRDFFEHIIKAEKR